MVDQARMTAFSLANTRAARRKYFLSHLPYRFNTVRLRLSGSGRDGTTGGGPFLHSRHTELPVLADGYFCLPHVIGGRLDHTGTHVEPTGPQHSVSYGRPSQDDGLRPRQYESSEEEILSLTPSIPLQHSFKSPAPPIEHGF